MPDGEGTEGRYTWCLSKNHSGTCNSCNDETEYLFHGPD